MKQVIAVAVALFSLSTGYALADDKITAPLTPKQAKEFCASVCQQSCSHVPSIAKEECNKECPKDCIADLKKENKITK